MNVHANDQQRLREIFCAVRQQATEHEKSQLLDQLCVGNASLRKQVEQLLAAASSASPVDRIGAMLNPTELEFNSAPEQSPRIDITSHPWIGPYKLLEQIGEGGMGTVFMAVQSQPIKRKVALKIIKPGMDTGQVIARFEVERQALAMMNHPNIAKVLDAGATEAGRPYFVMELVLGIPITEFCDLHKLDLRQRLEMFSTVCQALQHAHQKGIIHRDLKPSNILVELQDVTPVPKVIDFGVAKPIHQSLTERTLHTGFAQMIGTPLYMSPEQTQLSSLDVDTRSDVYSLGVLLYEMLTGSTPFDRDTLKQAGFDEMRRIIREDEPQKPSERISTLAVASLSTISDQRKVEPRRLSFSLGGELDWIVMKALEKDRARRYESASAFAQDIQRFLNDEPVQACPPTLAYRLRKYAKRHRGLMMTAAMLTTMLMVATGVSVSYAIQAQLAGKKALEARDDANVQKDAAVAAQALSDKRLKQSRVDVDRALKSLDTIVREVSSAEFAQLPGVDRVRDEILSKALKFYEEIIVEHDNDPRAREQQALAHANIANIYEGLGDSQSHLKELNESIRILEKVIVDNPNELQFQYSLLSPLQARLHSQLRTQEARLADAERCLEMINRCDKSGFRHDPSISAHIYYKVAESLPADSPRARQLVETAIQMTESRGLPPIPPAQIWLGDRANEAGDFEAAVKYYQRGIELYDIQGADTDRRRVYIERWLSAVETAKLANVYEKRNQTPQAEEAYRRAVTSARQLFREYHANQIVRDALRDRVIQLTDFLDRQGRTDDAIAQLDELLLEFPTSEGLHLAKASRHQKLKQFDVALAACSKAVDLAPSNSEAYYCRGNAFSGMGRDEQADEDYEKALCLDLDEEPLAPAFHDRLRTLAMGSASVRANPALAARWALQAEERLLVDSAGTVTLGIALWMNKQLDQAVERFNRAIELDPSDHYAYHCRGGVFKDLGRYTDAIADQSKSIELNPRHAWSWCNRGDLSMNYFQRYQEALADFDMAIQLEHDPRFYKGRVNAYIELKQFDKALADLDTISISKEAGPYDLHYQAALLSLKLGNQESYKARCLTMVKTTTATDKPIAKHFAAWTCALAPNAVDDYADAIALGRAAVEAEPANPQFQNGLGAILMRAGMYAEARPYLEGIVNNPGSENTWKTYTHYFLALTEHHLGNADAARLQLKTANELADAEVAGSIPWNRRLTIERLRKEAEATLSQADK